MVQDTEDAHRRMKHGECIIPSTYVATFNLGRMVPLATLSVALGGRSDHKVFSAVFHRATDTHTVTATFATGNVVIVGCKSEKHALVAAHNHAFLVTTTLHQPCMPINLTICNMVCRTEMPTSIPPPKYPGEPLPPTGGNRMHMLHTELQKMPHHVSSSYRPLKFRCLWWKARTYPHMGEFSPIITMAFFERGRGVLTSGVPGEEEVYNAIFKSIPDCGRGTEFREPTAEELDKERAEAVEIAKLQRKRKALSDPSFPDLPHVSPPPLAQTASAAAAAGTAAAGRTAKRYRRTKMAFDPHSREV
jgi:hypothetical protein